MPVVSSAVLTYETPAPRPHFSSDYLRCLVVAAVAVLGILILAAWVVGLFVAQLYDVRKPLPALSTFVISACRTLRHPRGYLPLFSAIFVLPLIPALLAARDLKARLKIMRVYRWLLLSVSALLASCIATGLALACR